MDKTIQEKFSLDQKSIAQTIEQTEQILSTANIDKNDALRLNLFLEEVMLKYRDALSDEVLASLRFSSFFGSLRVSLRVRGNSFNPFEEKESDISVMGSLMANSETLDMAWRYRGGANLVTFTVAKKQKINQLLSILIGIVSGVVIAFAVKALFPGSAMDIATKIIYPVTNAFTGLLCVMATLMCFGSIALGIVRLGDISTFSTVGKKMIHSFLMVAFILTLINTAWLVPGMKFGFSNKMAIDFYDFWKIIIDFVPNNILSPILEFNSVHIVIIGAMFGIAMLKMGRKADRLTEIFDEANTVAVLSNTYLNRFIPIYVGLMICSQILSDQRSLIQSYSKLILIVAIGEAVTIIVYTLVVCRRLKVGIRIFMRKLLPAFMISLSSASVGAAFSTTIDTMIGDLGVDDSFAPLAYNLGGILFRPGYCIVFTACSLFTANLVGIEVTWAWLLAAFLLSFILSVATPPVIGGTTVCFSILFSQLGINAQSLSIIISINAILEFLTVAVNNYCLQCQITLLGNSLGKVNLERLRQRLQ